MDYLLVYFRSIDLTKFRLTWKKTRRSKKLCRLVQATATLWVSGKKDTKLFFVISSTKLGRFWWNLVHGFLNKFAAKSGKRFPPHLNNISTLPSTLRNLKCLSRTWIYLILSVASKSTRSESSWLQHVGIQEKKVHRSRINHLDEPKQQLRTKRAELDHVVITAAIRQWHRQLVQISDVCFVYLLLQYYAHAMIKWIQIWRIWMPQLRWNNFWSFFLTTQW